jgi:hypothetical protein
MSDSDAASVKKPSLGAALKQIRDDTFAGILRIAEAVQLSADAFYWVARQIEEGDRDEWTMQHPVGLHADGQIIPSEKKWSKAELSRRYREIASLSLPVTGVYQLVTITEAWLLHVLRRVLIQFPHKMGQKRQVPAASILSAPTLEAARLAATDAYLHEMAYKGPRDFGDAASDILGVRIAEIPAFSRYLEVKATRDIWIHNLGWANEIYLFKAGSHARVKAGQPLPVDTRYFLHSYETCLQLLEETHDRLEEIWEPPEEAPLFTGTPPKADNEADTSDGSDGSVAET